MPTACTEGLADRLVWELAVRSLGAATPHEVEVTVTTRQQKAGSMTSVFVSPSSRHQVVTERVVARLRAAGLAALFVDFDPEQGIPAGRKVMSPVVV
jgi:hypothetical protein